VTTWELTKFDDLGVLTLNDLTVSYILT